MLKRVWKAMPQMIISLCVSVVYLSLDGVVYVRMMRLLDYSVAGDMDGLRGQIPGLIIFAMSLIPLGILTSLTKAWYRKVANYSMKEHYIKGVFRKNIAEFQKENTANYLSKLTNDCNTLDVNYVEGIYNVCYGITNFAVGMWIVSTVSPWMILLSIGVTIINVFISVLIQKPAGRLYKERSDMFDGYTSYIKEVLSAFHIIKTNNLSEKVTSDYYKKSEEIQQKGYLIERMMSFVFAGQSFLMNTSVYTVFCLLGYLAIQGKISAASVLIVIQGMQRIAWHLRYLSEALPKVFSSGTLSKKINDSLKNTDNYEEKEELKEFKDSIELKDVEFFYDTEEKKILQDVNMTLKKNGKYLIIGPSGGGKSTLLKLLRKYYTPTDGSIRIDGVSLRDIKKEDYFSMIANVEQQVFIFEDTLRNNITLYKEYSEEEIKKAIQAAGMTEFVNHLPQGLDTMVYDNGKNVSGGERSRIVIARAMLTKASILFMDEAFAALDMDRAKEIEQTILSLKHITVINVSHVLFQDTMSSYDAVFRVKGTVTRT